MALTGPGEGAGTVLRRWALRFAFGLPLAAVGGGGLWTWGALKFSYSSGERAGYVQKISKKGWLCKTWEGELAMVSLPGTLPQVFAFTVQDDGVAAAIEKTIGQRVALHYEQHRGLPSSCFGDTEYFITAVSPSAK